jgi:hypothetical protein
MQQFAAMTCRTCPVIAQCSALADELAMSLGTSERLALPGVWAGRVRGRPVLKVTSTRRVVRAP